MNKMPKKKYCWIVFSKSYYADKFIEGAFSYRKAANKYIEKRCESDSVWREIFDYYAKPVEYETLYWIQRYELNRH